MERRIQKKIDEHYTNVTEKILSAINNNTINTIIKQIIHDNPSCKLSATDFTKRKRVKNSVELSCRCSANKASGQQCTRRKKDGSQFCGTHIKGQPNGISNENPLSNVIQSKKEVWAQEIYGIIYYIDKDNNVYKAEDIMENKSNPTVLCKYAYDTNTDKYSLIK